MNWLSGMAGTLAGWMVNPWLFLAGAGLVSAPILIHLLNKRKFKIVDWAAMDFLLEADKRNRRRVRLENFILLLLRCLAVLLIGLLLARPFWSADFAGNLFDAVQYERIVIVDDSLSMQVRNGSTNAMDSSRKAVENFASGLASNSSDDLLTVYLTSRPERPLLNAVHIDEQSIAEISAELKEMKASDLPARLEETLLDVEKALASRASGVNRVVYVLTDLRRQDWETTTSEVTSSTTDAPGAKANPADATAKAAASDTTKKSPNTNVASVVETLNRLAKDTTGCFLVDMGSDEINNVQLAELVPREKALIAGVESRFDVVVRNYGKSDVNNVRVKFQAGETLPIEREIDTIPAGESAAVPVTYTFARIEDATPGTPVDPVAIRAEVISAAPLGEDRLAEDNTRFFAARVASGISALIVDGDPSAEYGQSESFYLQRALAPPGDALSGINVQVVSDTEFDTLPLEQYRVIFLCNLYRLNEARRDSLEKWVQAGGGLVLMLGDQIDQEVYNQELFRDGKGLMPARLEGVAGDEAGEAWVFFSIESPDHPALKIYAGDANPFLEGAKLFRYWQATVRPEDLKAGVVSVPARFTDTDRSPAWVEKTMGDGRIVAIMSTADVDWNNWAQEFSYVIAMQELTRHVARNSAAQGQLQVGEPILTHIDLTRYKLTDVAMTAADKPRTVLQPTPVGTGGAAETLWQVDYAETERRGFYKLDLPRTDGETEQLLFASNVSPEEGDLTRVDRAALSAQLADNVKIIDNQTLLGLGTDGAQGELWLYVLMLLASVLLLEQTLGWLFGRSR